jgi:uncharacterized protein (DUF1697 family)
MVTCAAFLRGINVGGHKSVPMNDLKKAFESLRFKNVRTLLASGNVIFETVPVSTTALQQKIEEKLEKYFGLNISVLIRTMDELQQLSELQPFKGITVTPKIQLYVTFFSEKTKSNLKIPYVSPDKSLKILQVSNNMVFSCVTLSPGSGTIKLMKILEKEFGQNVTTRNWNTIVRILNI